VQDGARGAGGAAAEVNQAAGKLAFTALFVAEDDIFMLGMARFQAKTPLGGYG